MQIAGEPIPIADQVNYVTNQIQGQFAASQNGVLVYQSGGFGERAQLTWMDRSGKERGTVGAPGRFRGFAIAPNGKNVAVARIDADTGFADIWLHDLERGAASRFTVSLRNDMPVWSPDGSRIAFRSIRDGVFNVYQLSNDGATQDEALDNAPRTKQPVDWSRDGRYIIEEISDVTKTGTDLWVLPLFGDRKPVPYLQTEFTEQRAKLSPNGRWLEYVSDETRRNEVYVQAFPTAGHRSQVSTNGGIIPIWSRDGKELFFIGADHKLMTVEVKRGVAGEGVTFEPGAPKSLFDTPALIASYDVTTDGRFLIPVPLEPAIGAPMTVVVNLTAALVK